LTRRRRPFDELFKHLQRSLAPVIRQEMKEAAAVRHSKQLELSVAHLAAEEL
jgi:hypothetical protein